MVRKASYVKEGALSGCRPGFRSFGPKSRPAAVRAAVVAPKRRNGRGAKGGRKVDGH